MKRIITLAMCLSLVMSAFSQDITGAWNGLLDVSAAKLRLVFHIEEKDGIYSTTVDSPDQKANGMPTTSTTFENQQLQIKIANIGATFE
ncbi:MAG: alpha/beta hydrolase, partial [Candidatus Azobacteroides sp.]|nr:alpha/beta hydrolase [Candidatus Azobacteroides sp.]